MHNRLFNNRQPEKSTAEKSTVNSSIPSTNIAYPANVTASDIAKGCFISPNENIIHALNDFIPCKPGDDLAKLSEAYTRPAPEIRIITCNSNFNICFMDLYDKDTFRKCVEQGLQKGSLYVFGEAYTTIEDASSFAQGLTGYPNSPHIVAITSPISFGPKDWIGMNGPALPFEVYAYQLHRESRNRGRGTNFVLLDTPLKTHSQPTITDVTLALAKVIPANSPSAAPESSKRVAALKK